jgi:hypothetical protein
MTAGPPEAKSEVLLRTAASVRHGDAFAPARNEVVMIRWGSIGRSKALWVAALGAMVCAFSVSGAAEENYRQQMKGLDEQVQEVKSETLGIAAELNRLEEKLLYPSNTHVAVFVAMPQSDAFRLDAMQIQIDGQLVAHYIYSFKELEALQKGGMQRIYTGNVATGAHEMEVVIAGKLPSGKELSRTERFSFSKSIEPKLLNITVGGSELRLGE